MNEKKSTEVANPASGSKKQQRSGSELRGDTTRFTTKKTDAQKRYLKRQSKDPYTAKARAEGYRSRAAYKLIELDEKFNLLKNAKLAVDLGAAPGGWCQVLLETNPSVQVLALDILPVEPLANTHIIEGDFLTDEVFEQVMDYMNGKPKADVVLSDLACNTTGHSKTDHLRSMNLCELAADCALKLLRPGGHFVCKIFQGGGERTMRDDLSPKFEKMHFAKPESSRQGSREMFLIGYGFKG